MFRVIVFIGNDYLCSYNINVLFITCVILYIVLNIIL